MLSNKTRNLLQLAITRMRAGPCILSSHCHCYLGWGPFGGQGGLHRRDLLNTSTQWLSAGPSAAQPLLITIPFKRQVPSLARGGSAGLVAVGC